MIFLFESVACMTRFDLCRRLVLHMGIQTGSSVHLDLFSNCCVEGEGFNELLSFSGD